MVRYEGVRKAPKHFQTSQNSPKHDKPGRLGRPGSSAVEKRVAATYSPAFAVPSARWGLTSLFGMGRGGSPTLWQP